MSRPKLILGLATVVLALGLISVPAWGVELPEFTNETTTTGTSGTGTLETNAAIVGKIICTSRTWEFAATSRRLGTYHLHATGCICKKTPALGGGTARAESLGDVAGIILQLGEYHLTRLASAHVSLWFLISNYDVDCLYPTEILLRWEGNYLVLIEPILTKTKTFKLNIAQSGGKQAITEYENDSGSKVAAEGIKVEVSNTGGFIKSAEEVQNTVLTESVETEIIKTT